jgi:hypothetical protein
MRRPPTEITASMAAMLAVRRLTAGDLCDRIGVNRDYQTTILSRLLLFQDRGLVRIAGWEPVFGHGLIPQWEWVYPPFALPDVPPPAGAVVMKKFRHLVQQPVAE